MGRVLESLAESDPAFQIVDRVDRRQPLPESSRGDVAIDFSTPEQCCRTVSWCQRQGMPLVIGTTGLDESTIEAVQRAARHIPVCMEANFSVGILVLQALVRQAATSLGEDFDIEVLELHHGRKQDAPSGTALALGKSAMGGRNQGHEGRQVLIRAGAEGVRQAGDIGYQSLRGGNVAGEHTVFFLGNNERLELTHRATDRRIFAQGALRAARILQDRQEGLYCLADLIL